RNPGTRARAWEWFQAQEVARAEGKVPAAEGRHSRRGDRRGVRTKGHGLYPGGPQTEVPADPPGRNLHGGTPAEAGRLGPAPPKWPLHRHGKFPGVRELQQQTVHGPYPIEDKVQVRGGVPGGEGDAAGPARYPEGF